MGIFQKPSMLLLGIDNRKKTKGTQQGHKMQHNDGKDSFLGSLLVLPVELGKRIDG